MSKLEKIIKQNPENHEAFVYLYKKLDAKPGEKQFYAGYHKGHPNDGYHHSSTDDDLDLDISKHDFTFEVLHWGTMDEMLTKEHSILKEANAASNSEWYNKSNGAPSVVKDIDLLQLSKWADEFKDFGQVMGISPEIKTFQKKTMKAELKKMFMKFQAREKELIQPNTVSISSWIDKYQGDLKELFKVENMRLIVVVLEGVEIDGKEADLIVGGNHTIAGTISSKHGKEINLLIIPKDKHCLDYNAAKQFSSLLNKAKKQPGVNNDAADILKTITVMCVDYGYNSQSEQVDDLLDFHECDPASKKKLKTRLTKELKKKQLTGRNWKLYDTDDGKSDIENKKQNILDVNPKSRLFVASSGYCNVGMDLVKMRNEIRNGLTYSNVTFVIYHPSPEWQQKWFAEKLVGNEDFVESTCRMLKIDFPRIKEMTYDFIYMETTKSDLV